MTTKRADQRGVVKTVLETAPDAAIISNLGVASWMLESVEDRELNFYLRGAMGGTTPTALGLALSTDKEVVVLEGDGSLLMSLGCLSTVAEYEPSNLSIVVMDNAVYETTGGQESASPTVDFAAVAEASGIYGDTAQNETEFKTTFADAFAHEGPSLVECLVEKSDIRAPKRFNYSHSYHTDRFREALLK